MLLVHLRIEVSKAIHFAFLHINKFVPCTATYNMYNSLAFFVHKPFTFLQITFCYFGMNHIFFFFTLLYQTQKWFVKYPLTAFTFFKFHSNRKKKKKNRKSIAIYKSIHWVVGSGNSWQAKQKNVNTIAANVDKDNTFNAYRIITKQVKQKCVTEQYNTSAQSMNGSTITYPLNGSV